MMSRHVTPAPERKRFGLYRLCLCPTCSGDGSLGSERCTDCRGEGRVRDLVAETDTLEDMATAFATCVAEGEFLGCGLGLVDREGEVNRKWLVPLWPPTARTVTANARGLAAKRWEGVKT